ncbi:alpha-isopropylmalate synthase regulatory domain-containing protein, partial [Salmonella enterica]|uniref:alpha-isopropylmalate synthase regulatory domain-containing protein n=1 Tax=Salmonella enterica TaxID=28901 RepID=UPI003FA7A218
AGLSATTGRSIRVLDYHEHAIGSGAHARAAAYLELEVDRGQRVFGVGIDSNIVSASLAAIVSGLERATMAVYAETATAA